MAKAKKIELTSNRETNKWRTLLLKRKNEILINENEVKIQALEELSPQGTGEISQHRLHPGDLGSDMQQVELLDSLSERNIETMQRIEEALERLDRGEYGICRNCGDRIPLERLQAIPEAAYCLSCESELEEIQSRSIRSNISSEAREELSLGDRRVSDIMHENPIAVSEEESLAVVIELMTENKIRHLPVVNEDGEIQGIVSDRDLLDLALRSPHQLDSYVNSKRVADIMTRSPEVISPDTSLSEAGNYLLDQKISCLPVVEGDRLVGIVTESDFVKLVS